MRFVGRHLNPGSAPLRISSRLNSAARLLALLTLCALAPAALIPGKEGSASPPTRSARVSLAGLDLSTVDGARGARERIRKAAHDLCARNPGQRPIDFCVDDAMAAAQRQIKARTAQVSLADLDLRTPQGVHAARDRLHAAVRRACQELRTGSDASSTRYSACVDETFEHALRQADFVQRMSVDF
jgi:UrcA family protein